MQTRASNMDIKIVSTFIVCCVAMEAIAPVFSTGDWQESLDSLKRLSSSLSTKRDKASINTLKEVNALIEASNISGSKCNQDRLEELNEALYTRSTELKLDAYRTHCVEDQYLFCHRAAVQQVEKAVAGLSDRDQRGMNTLREFYWRQTSGMLNLVRFHLNPPQLSKVLLEFMAHSLSRFEAKTLKKEEGGESLFNAQFDSVVSSLCRKVEGVVEPKAALYDTIASERIVRDQMDDFTKDWVLNARMCRYLNKNLDKCRRETYRALITSKPEELGDRVESAIKSTLNG